MYKGITFADLHMHTRYSIACSKDADIDGYSAEAEHKGIDIIGTGDCFHAEQMKAIDKLEEITTGVFMKNGTRILITGEVSLIYKENGRTRKIHVLTIMSGRKQLKNARRLLEKISKIDSDGRPIIKMPQRHYVNEIKHIDPESMNIPAHIWTPHFGILGQKSGYDALEESVDDINVFSAMETGLSSDIIMNRECPMLDQFSLVSFSDAHSPGKHGREATMLKIGNIDYMSIKTAIETGKGLHGTLEFYPEEGKYFASGHRKCSYSTTDAVSLCPYCKKPLTEGVYSRIRSIAGQKTTMKCGEYVYTMPVDIIARYMKKLYNMKESLKSIKQSLERMPLMHMMTYASADEIDAATGISAGEMIVRIREHRIDFLPGYDGIFGKPDIL